MMHLMDLPTSVILRKSSSRRKAAMAMSEAMALAVLMVIPATLTDGMGR
jgi:hypothetical protein